jgi:hypothetical protein
VLIVVDTARNELHFDLGPGTDTGGRGGETIAAPADLDIGERGGLLSLEINLPQQAPRTLVIDDRPDPYARTARIEVRCTIAADGSLHRVTIPRRGPGYELSYPSGNECWIDASGMQHCAITRSM